MIDLEGQRGFSASPQQDQPGASAACQSCNVVVLGAIPPPGCIASLLAFGKLQGGRVEDLLPETV